MAHSAEIKKSYFSLLFWYEKGIFHPGFSKSLLILFRGGGRRRRTRMQLGFKMGMITLLKYLFIYLIIFGSKINR